MTDKEKIDKLLKKERRIRCKFCGARLKRDMIGPYCPTANCQWSLTGSGYKEAP